MKEIITPGDYIITSEIEELEGLLNNIDVEVLKDIEEQEKNNLEPKETVANNKSKKKTKKGMIKVDCTEDFEE